MSESVISREEEKVECPLCPLRSMADVLASVGDVRRALMDRLDSVTVEQMGSGALHPRLQVPMRLIDLCHFVAEHDDYHLARITELRRQFGG